MKSLALVTPWPPQHTGIADYAYDLATALAHSGARVVVYTTEPKPQLLPGVEVISVQTDDTMAALENHENIVYQLGNNTSFHLWMIPLLSKYPGTVHIHDLVMHHMAAWLTWLQDDATGYIELLEKWYGLPGLARGLGSLASGDLLWNSEDITEFPLFEEYAQHATSVIVHSEFALKHLRAALPTVPSYIVPQLYNIEPRSTPHHRLSRIAILGGVDPQKKLNWVLDALRTLSDEGVIGDSLTLDIVGSLDARCEYLRAIADELESDHVSIRFHGRVTEQQFLELFAATDLCIALRFPTMGETSAIVMRALQLGVPTIVNDIGWYSELPAHIVHQLPVHDCPAHLATQLRGLLQDEDSYRDWAAACHGYATTAFNLTDYGYHYLDICCNPEALELITTLQSRALRDFGLSGESVEDALLEQILLQGHI